MPPGELVQRQLGKRPVVVRAAEAPRPGARVAFVHGELEILRECRAWRRHARGVPAGAVARKLSEHHPLVHAQCRERPAEDVGVALRMLQIGIGVELEKVQFQRGIVPGPEIVEARTPNRRERAGMPMDQRTQSRDQLRQHVERQWTRHARAQIALPFIDDEVRFIHELDGEDLRSEVGALAGLAVAPQQRLEHTAQQRLAADLRVQHVRSAVREPRLVERAGRRIGNRLHDPFEHPAVIEQHEIEADPRVSRDLERGVEVSEQMGIGTESAARDRRTECRCGHRRIRTSARP